MSDLLSVDEALDRILARVEALPAERVMLAHAAARVSAETIDLGGRRPAVPELVDGRVCGPGCRPPRRAGDRRPLGGGPAVGGDRSAAGQAIEISTGAVVPDGADTVVPVERVEVDGDDRVTIPEPVPTRDNIREPGGDVRIGSTLVSPG